MRLVVERRKDASGQLRRTAALDQRDQLVQIHSTLARECRRMLGLESGTSELALTPPTDVIDRWIAIRD